MKSLVYISRPLVAMIDREAVLDDIQYVSVARNTTLDITGLLITTQDHFAQLLEGPAKAVESVMASMSAMADVAVRRAKQWGGQHCAVVCCCPCAS